MKNHIKRAGALLLGSALILSLAACGKGGAQAPSDTAAAQTAAPEFAYKAEYAPLTENDSGSPLLMTDDGIYMVSLEKVGEAKPEGAVAEYEGQYDINEARLSFLGFDGSERKLSGYVPLTSSVDSTGKRDFSSSSHPEAAALDENGGLVVLEQVDTLWSEAPESVTADAPEYFDYSRSQTEYFIRRLDETGAETGSFELSLEDSYVSSMLITGDGTVVLALDSSFALYSPEGESLGSIPTNGYSYGLTRLRDGSVGALVLDLSTYDTQLQLIDVKTRSLGKDAYTLPSNVYNTFDGGGDYDFYYISGSSLYGWSVADGEAAALLSFIDCDVDGDTLNNVHVSADGGIYALSVEFNSNYTSSKTELVTLEKVPYESIPQKQHLTLASAMASSELRGAVISFNRSSDKYHIDIKDYYEMTGSDYDAACTKLLTEVAAGTLPDLLDLSDAMPYSQLAAKGILEDLYPYLDSDPELGREDFFRNVLSAYEVGGRLCAAVSGFGIITASGASSVVGTTPGWTYDDYYAALATMPEGCQGLDFGFTRETMLQLGLSIDLDTYLDWTTGRCSFDSDEFRQLLEFAGTFPSDASLENHETSELDSSDYRIAQGQQMLRMESIYSFNDYSTGNPFGTDMTYIGFPNSTGEDGSVISGINTIGMTSACSDKQAGWEFLRTFFGEEYQKTLSYLPTNRRAFDALLKEATKIEYETDANGNILLDENGERKRKVIAVMYDGTTYTDIYSGITEERARTIETLANTTTKLFNYDRSILDIVLGEAQAYFAGQKTLDETASLIQSKANIYVNEQR